MRDFLLVFNWVLDQDMRCQMLSVFVIIMCVSILEIHHIMYFKKKIYFIN